MSALMEDNGGSMSYTIDPVNDPWGAFFVNGNRGYGVMMYLPDASTYNGLELSFFDPPIITRTITDEMQITYTGGIYYSDADGFAKATSAIHPVGLVILKAIGGFWWIVSGNAQLS